MMIYANVDSFASYVATCVDGMRSEDTEVELRRSASLLVAQVEQTSTLHTLHTLHKVQPPWQLLPVQQ